MVISASNLLTELQRTLCGIIKDIITNTTLQYMVISASNLLTKLQTTLGGIIKDSITNTQSVTGHGNKCQ